MMVVVVLSTTMPKNVKLSNGNIRLHLFQMHAARRYYLTVFCPFLDNGSSRQICIHFFYIFHTYLQYGIGGCEIIEINIVMYIYSWSRKKKENYFEKCLSVRPSVIYTITQEGVKIIKCVFFCLKGVYSESKLPKFRPERTKAYEVRAEWNFDRFFICRDQIDEIDSNYFSFKGMG